MKTFLLDTNVLIALFWPAHAQHSSAMKWFASRGHQGWATCLWTQSGFIRIVSNPAFSKDAVSPLQAARVMQQNLLHEGHVYWTENRGPSDILVQSRYLVQNHKQVTDACLLALAEKHGGILATFDRGISTLLSSNTRAEQYLEILLP